jgi:hypothetical protein
LDNEIDPTVKNEGRREKERVGEREDPDPNQIKGPHKTSK